MLTTVPATMRKAHLMDVVPLAFTVACSATRSALLAATEATALAIDAASPGRAANVPAGASCCWLGGHGSTGRTEVLRLILMVLLLLLVLLLQRQRRKGVLAVVECVVPALGPLALLQMDLCLQHTEGKTSSQ